MVSKLFKISLKKDSNCIFSVFIINRKLLKSLLTIKAYIIGILKSTLYSNNIKNSPCFIVFNLCFFEYDWTDENQGIFQLTAEDNIPTFLDPPQFP